MRCYMLLVITYKWNLDMFIHSNHEAKKAFENTTSYKLIMLIIFTLFI